MSKQMIRMRAGIFGGSRLAVQFGWVICSCVFLQKSMSVKSVVPLSSQNAALVSNNDF